MVKLYPLCYFYSLAETFPDTEHAICDSCYHALGEDEDGLAVKDGELAFYHVECWLALPPMKRAAKPFQRPTIPQTRSRKRARPHARPSAGRSPASRRTS
jgi:hypothetical protein